MNSFFVRHVCAARNGIIDKQPDSCVNPAAMQRCLRGVSFVHQTDADAGVSSGFSCPDRMN